MKKVTLFLLLIAFISCEKSNSSLQGNSLTGKWTEVENYISPGTVWTWQSANNIAIDIKSDLTYTSNNENYFWGRKGNIESITDSTFVLKSSVLSISQPCKYKIKDGILEIWYPGCIEGCGSRFKR